MSHAKPQPLRIGLAGLGTVGGGVYKILKKNAIAIGNRAGAEIKITAVSARSKNKDRGFDLSGVRWIENPQDLASCEDVDVVVEMMGGESGPALSLVKAALENGKSVVTANKALLAHHGIELAKIAEKKKVHLRYEAAVAGGIPIIKLIREGLAANILSGLYGIMNGTCNYILTTMEKTGRSFSDVLDNAQKMGYAEADPTLDIGGGDSGHKLALLTSLAFGCRPDFKGLALEGIEKLTAEDLIVADEFGCRIKLIGQATRLEDGRILQMVSPCLVPKTSPLAHVDDVMNGIYVIGDFIGPSFVAGRGAGEGPTASAIVADLMDIVREGPRPVFGVETEQLASPPSASRDDWSGEYYIRLVVKDRPGVIAEIAPILRDHKISIESLIQRGRSEEDQPVSIVLTTHETTGKNMRLASEHISKLESVLDNPVMMPILDI